MRITLFASGINHIGGVETFLYNFCKHFDDVTVLFVKAHPSQLIKLSKVANLKHFDRWTEHETDVAIFATTWYAHPDFMRIKAKTYLQMIHADLEYFKTKFNYNYTCYANTHAYIAVSEVAKKSFEKLHNKKAHVISNLIDPVRYPRQTNDVLTFITVSRYSGEKGFNRMIKMAEFLQDRVPFKWIVYSNGFNHPLFECHAAKHDVIHEIAKADFLVQLSDSEGNPYCVQEALSQGTPVILTDFPSAHDFVTDGDNGWIVSMDLSDIEKILLPLTNKRKFKPASSGKDWLKIIELCQQK